MNVNKKCLQCSKNLAGRPDKRFCDYLCRNEFHNSVYREESHQTRGVDRVLKRNRRIMEALCAKGQIRVERKRLLSAGFDFDFFTHLRENERGKQFRYCYEYGYTALDGETVEITIRKPLYM